MEAILIGVGFLLRILFLRSSNFSKLDFVKIFGSLGLFIFSMLILGTGDFQAVIILFVIAMALLYKDQILPKINEGHGLLYSLLGGYIFYKLNFLTSVDLSVFEQVLVVCFGAQILLFIYLCICRIRVAKYLQGILFALVLMTGIYIGLATIFYENIIFSPLAYIVMGFIYFEMLCAIWYLAMFIPIKSYRQTWANRFRRIRQHADNFEVNYLDIDADKISTMLILLGVGVLYVNDYFKIMDWFTLFSIVTLCATMLLSNTKIISPDKDKPA